MVSAGEMLAYAEHGLPADLAIKSGDVRGAASSFEARRCQLVNDEPLVMRLCAPYGAIERGWRMKVAKSGLLIDWSTVVGGSQPFGAPEPFLTVRKERP